MLEHQALVLRLNKGGMPQAWITLEEAAKQYTQDRVLFELGDATCRLHGGWNQQGAQSVLDLSSIIACEGKVNAAKGNVPLCNRYLFRRDDNICLYCGQRFSRQHLTRDHIIPRCKSGKDTWTNVATACYRCNHHKGSRTLEEAGLELIAVPFKPNLYEQFYLMNHRILADQMAFLRNHFTDKRNWQL